MPSCLCVRSKSFSPLNKLMNILQNPIFQLQKSPTTDSLPQNTQNTLNFLLSSALRQITHLIHTLFPKQKNIFEEYSPDFASFSDVFRTLPPHFLQFLCLFKNKKSPWPGTFSTPPAFSPHSLQILYHFCASFFHLFHSTESNRLCSPKPLLPVFPNSA